jgi:hypothetical protein
VGEGGRGDGFLRKGNAGSAHGGCCICSGPRPVRMYFTGRLAPDFAMRGTAVFNQRRSRERGVRVWDCIRSESPRRRPQRAKRIPMEIKPNERRRGQSGVIYAGKELSPPVEVNCGGERIRVYPRGTARPCIRWNRPKEAGGGTCGQSRAPTGCGSRGELGAGHTHGINARCDGSSKLEVPEI